MDVANEVQQEFQGGEAFVGRGVGAGEFSGKLVDLIDDAGLRRAERGQGGGRQFGMAETGGVERRGMQLDIDEVPLPRAAAGAIGVGAAQMIGPGGLGGHVVLGERVIVGGEHGVDLSARGRCHEGVGDGGDDLVAFVAPGMGRMWGEDRPAEKQGR